MTIVPDTGRKLTAPGPSPRERRDGPSPGIATTAAPPRPSSLQPPTPQKSAVKKDSAAAKDTGAEKKGGKKKLLIIALVVVVLAGGVYYMKFRPHPLYKPGQPVPNGKVVSLGTITANTADGRLVQVGIALQMSVVGNAKQEATDAPVLTNAVINYLADWTYAQLLTDAARASLQSQLLKSFQKELGTADGAAQQVNAVYFTSFILQ